MINMFERKKHSVRAKFRILKAKTLIKRITKFRKYLPSVNLSLKSLFSEAAVHRCFSQMLGKHLCWPLQTSFSEHLRWLLLDFRGSKYFFQLNLVLTADSHMSICISRPQALCLTPGPKFAFTGVAPNLCLPALAPNLYLSALAPNLYLPALAPNLYLTAQPSLSLHIPTLSPQFVFTGPGLWFVRTQAAKLIYPQWCWIM